MMDVNKNGEFDEEFSWVPGNTNYWYSGYEFYTTSFWYSWGFWDNDEGALGRSGAENMPMQVDASLNVPMTDISAAIENQAKLEIYKMENNLANLATIAGAAPMIGFLGTVIGMIVAFHEMASAGGNIDVEMASKKNIVVTNRIINGIDFIVLKLIESLKLSLNRY